MTMTMTATVTYNYNISKYVYIYIHICLLLLLGVADVELLGGPVHGGRRGPGPGRGGPFGRRRRLGLRERGHASLLDD